ncbi:MAG: tetratricopeptide repeat protein [Thermodesulfobacteriota bacterium]
MIKRIWSKGNRRLYDRAIGLFNQGHYRQAIPLFQKIITDTTSGGLSYRLASFYCAQAHYDLGRILFSMGNYLGALSEFEQALRIDPERSRVYEYMGHCHEKIGARENSPDLYRRIAEINPYNYPPGLKIIAAFHRLGIWDRVEDACRRRLRQYPHHADLHYTLGLTYLGTGKPMLAIPSFEQAVAINPHYWPARIKLGTAYANTGAPDKAAAQFSLLLEKFPDYVDLYHHLGSVHSGSTSGDQTAALEWFQKALSANPGFSAARIKLAMLLFSSGRHPEGIRLLREGSRVYPDDRSLRLLLEYFDKTGRVRESETRDNGTAEALLHQTIGTYGQNLAAAPNVVEMLMLTEPIEDENLPGLLDQVIEAVRCAAHLYTRYPDFQFGIGSLHYRAGKLAEAETAFREALQLNPTYTRARIMLFNTLKTAGKSRSALEIGDLLLNRQVGYPDFLLSFGELCFRLKDYDKAGNLFKRALERNPGDEKARRLMQQLLEKKKEP